MPWKDVKPMDEKVCFIADFLRGTTSFSQLCLRYGISRKTGYKWTQRYQEGGTDALDERSRKPKGHPAQTPYAVQQAILALRQQRDPPGPKKIHALLAQRLEPDEIPSITTIYKILKRDGQIEPKKRSRRMRQQKVLDAFRVHYNEQRPHEGLGQRSPASCYTASNRPYPRHLPEIEYPSYLSRGHVSSNGIVYWRAYRIYVGHLLTGEQVGIEQVGG